MYQDLIIKAGRERSLINRHPWLFSGGVAKLPSAQPGDIVAVRNPSGQLFGYGFIEPRSPITCRIFEFTNQPRTFDQAYWNQRVATALAMRKQVLDLSQTDCFRLIHAEGDYMPGVIADVYGKVVVVQLRISGTRNRADQLVRAIQEAGFPHVYLKNKEESGQAAEENGWLTDPAETTLQARENGIVFQVDIAKGQKTGFFIDQRESRSHLRQQSRDARVLNAFSYSGGFSAYALAGGAREVISVDISKDACALAQRNIEANFGAEAPHQAVAADCFKYIKEADREFDVVVLDPPAFAKSLGAVKNASRGYKELNMAGMRLVKPGGLLYTFSCSQHIDRTLFRQIVFAAAADIGREMRIIHQCTQPADHPINIYHPEGEYLKGLVLQLL